MPPPSQGFPVSIEAISGITGSISIACWVVVFSPQIIENFRRQSADGLSLYFLSVWLAGDIANLLGSFWQRVLPTMTILAVYYTFADIVLVLQCLYYRAVNSKKESATQQPRPRSRRESTASHLSPATPLLDHAALEGSPVRQSSMLKAFLFNSSAIALVFASGVFGWWVSNRGHGHDRSDHYVYEKPESPEFNTLGQVFGYLCAVLYLASRVPQIVQNFKRKSVEGLSLLFFLFACFGNVTYVISILAYSPSRQDGTMDWSIYWRYILVNASWLIGSVGTLGLDLAIFVQFFIYMPASLE